MEIIMLKPANIPEVKYSLSPVIAISCSFGFPSLLNISVIESAKVAVVM